MTTAELHVLPDQPTGGWVVGADDGRPPLSWHASVNAAEDAAKRLASARGAQRILLHDRYARVRTVAPRGATGRR
jgi:hypothetical protein